MHSYASPKALGGVSETLGAVLRGLSASFSR